MTREGVMDTHGVTPYYGVNVDESLAGYLPYHKTFIVCNGYKFWRPACMYMPDVCLSLLIYYIIIIINIYGHLKISYHRCLGKSHFT